MGLDLAIKQIIKTDFGWPEMPEEAARNINVIIDDISLNIRGILTGIASWDMLGDRVRTRIETHTNNATLESYVATVDEPWHAPRVKDVTRRDRAAKTTARPFTVEERATFKIGVGPIPEPADEFFARLMATRALHGELYTFLATEAAMANLRPGVELVLDGFCPRGIFEKQRCGEPVKIVNVRGTDRDKLSPNELHRIDGVGVIRVTRTAEGEPNSVFLSDSHRIGESDLKVPYIISRQRDGANIFVRVCDTDVILILLLHVRNYVRNDNHNPDDGQAYARYGIYMDTQGPGRKPGSDRVPVLDIVVLWRIIMVKFNRDFHGTIRHPIETFAVLMLMGGSDYVEHLPQMTVLFAWKTFMSLTGRSILFPSAKHNEPFICVGRVVGQPDVRIDVNIEEERLRHFMAYIYHTKSQKNVPWNVNIHGNVESSIRARNKTIEAIIAKTGKITDRMSWMPPDDMALRGFVRRLAWNLDYFSNGTKDPPFCDPLLANEDTGVSIYGWEFDAETNQIVVSKTVEGV